MSFATIPEYLNRLRKENPESIFRLQRVGNAKRVFICHYTAVIAVSYILPFIAIDGINLSSSQVLLVCVGRDPNNDIVPLCWGLAESESQDSWDWFFDCMKEGIPSLFDPAGSTIQSTIITDRNEGLQKATYKYLSHHNHAYCCFQLKEDIKNGHGGLEAANLFFKLARSINDAQFEERMECIISAGGIKVKEFIESLDKSRWLARDFPGRRFGHLIGGVSDFVHEFMLEHIEKSTLELLDSVWNKVLRLRAGRYWVAKQYHDDRSRSISRQASKVLTPYALELANESIKSAVGLQVVAMSRSRDNIEAWVTENDETEYKVDVLAKSCTCRWYQDHNIPCSHAMASILAAEPDFTKWMDWTYCSMDWKFVYQSDCRGPVGWDENDNEIEWTGGVMRAVEIDDLVHS